MKDSDLHVRLENKKRIALEKIAEKQKRSLSNLIQLIIDKFLEEEGQSMKKLMICLIFFFAFSACDSESTTPQSLLAMQIQATGTGIDITEKQSYKIYGCYITGNQRPNIFSIKNNYLPRQYQGLYVQYLVLFFDKEIFRIDNIKLNGKPIQSTIAEYDYKQVYINLFYILDEKFVITGNIIFLDGNIITVKTPTITYK